VGFFTTRERADLERSTPDVEGKARELARRDFAPRRRVQDRAPDNDLVAGNAGALLGQVTGASLKQIDALIVELQSHRERLLAEGARVQRAIVEYAKMSQSTMQSTRIISESLSYWNRIPESPKDAPKDAYKDAYKYTRKNTQRAADVPVRTDAELWLESRRSLDVDRELERSVAEALARPLTDVPAEAAPVAAAALSHMVEPDVGEPQVGEHVAEHQVAEHHVAEDQAAEQQMAEAYATEPQVAEPHATEPHIAEPHVAEPHVAEPHVAEAAVVEPAATVLPDDAATVHPDSATELAATVIPDEQNAEPNPESIPIAEAPSVVADRPDEEVRQTTGARR
jgi:hypothetical protein